MGTLRNQENYNSFNCIVDRKKKKLYLNNLTVFSMKTKTFLWYYLKCKMNVNEHVKLEHSFYYSDWSKHMISSIKEISLLVKYHYTTVSYIKVIENKNKRRHIMQKQMGPIGHEGCVASFSLIVRDVRSDSSNLMHRKIVHVRTNNDRPKQMRFTTN